MHAIQFVSPVGATVIAINKDKYELLKSLGAKYSFDYKVLRSLIRLRRPRMEASRMELIA